MVLPPEGDGFVLIEFFSDNGAKERRRVNVSELKCVEWWFQPVPDDEDDPASPAKKLPDFIKVGAYFTDIDGGSASRVVAISDDFGVEFEYICDIRNIIDTDAFTPEECKSLGEWFRPSTEDERWLFEVNEIRALIKDGASVWLPKVGKLGRADRCVEGLATISFVDDYGNNRLLTRQAISELAPASPWPRKPERPAAEGLAAVAEAAE
jgi:hypothetical protein